MEWRSPVTDRRAQDVAQGRKKGYCNAVDLNRLEGNCGWLGERLRPGLRMKEWVREDFPTAGELARILENIAALRAAYYTRSDVPATPEPPLTTWEKWNAAEAILQDLHSLWEANESAWARAGEGWGGEEMGVI